MTIVYVITKYITVIGSILKGFWEHLFCRILGVPVSDARYLQATELCGHVEHDFTKTKAVTFFINYLPGMMNRLFGYGMVSRSFLYESRHGHGCVLVLRCALLYRRFAAVQQRSAL